MEKFREFNGELDRMPDHLTDDFNEEDSPNRILQVGVMAIISILVIGYLVGSIFPSALGT